MSEQTMSERLQAHLNSINEKGETKQLVGSAAMLGAGIGGAAKMMGKGNAGFLKGAAMGAGAGVTAALLIGGGVGIANLIKKAREKGAAETKASIRAAVSRAQDNHKLTGTQKAAIRNNAQAAITKIDQTFKKQTNESLNEENLLDKIKTAKADFKKRDIAMYKKAEKYSEEIAKKYDAVDKEAASMQKDVDRDNFDIRADHPIVATFHDIKRAIGAVGVATVITLLIEMAIFKKCDWSLIKECLKAGKEVGAIFVPIVAVTSATINSIISKIVNTYKNEQFDDEGVDNVTEDPADANESLGKSILERLDSLVEEGNMKKAAAGGAVAGAVAGHAIAKHSAKKAKHAAVNNYKAAVRGTNNAINNAGAAKRIYDKEARVANALKAKQPQGVVAKVKNAVAQHQQAKRVNAAGASLAGHPGVKAAMGKEKQAFNTMKSALKKVKKPGGGLKGAAIGAGIAAGAYGLHKLANRNK